MGLVLVWLLIWPLAPVFGCTCVCVAWGAGFLSMLLWGMNRLGVWLIKDVPGRYLAGWLW